MFETKQIPHYKVKNVGLRGIKTNFCDYGGYCAPGSSVGIATYYGLDGPGSKSAHVYSINKKKNPGGDEIFRSSRPALGPTHPPVKWYRVFPRVKVRPMRAADHSPPSSAADMEE